MQIMDKGEVIGTIEDGEDYMGYGDSGLESRNEYIATCAHDGETFQALTRGLAEYWLDVKHQRAVWAARKAELGLRLAA